MIRTLALLISAAAFAQSPLDTMGWLAGHWRADSLWGGSAEEFFTPPAGGSITGLFRFIKDGKLAFTEYIHIELGNGQPVFRLKHFNPGLKGWEEKDASVKFTVARNEPGLLELKSPEADVTYRRRDAGSIEVTMWMTNRGKRSETTFVYHRVR
ncbi:MAG: hypothetical protein FJW30_21245 [Acidobacteria bacterium]|nr:hypothetical protein [Acidobacteriota bacterium]